MEATILRLRKERGLRQKKVAQEANMTASALSQYENKKRKLPVNVAKKLGEIYGVEWSTLYEDEKEGA